MKNFTLLLWGMLSLPFTSMAQDSHALIKEQPAGRLISMSKATIASTIVRTPDGAMPESHSLDNMISEIVEGDDGCIYLKNPFTYFHTDSWIKGERGEDNQVIFHTPQPVYQQGNSIFYLGKICIKDVNSYEDEQYGDPTAEEGNDIVFTYQDGVLSQKREKRWSFDGKGQPVQVDASPMLALVSQNYITKGYSASYTGYSDYNLTLTAVTDEVAQLPDGIEPQDYQLTFTLNGERYLTFTSMAFDGTDVYLAPFKEGLPNGWAKGNMKEGKVTFPSGQYLGPNLNANRSENMASYAHLYLMTGGYDADKNNNADDGYYYNDEIVFDYDAQTGTLSSDDGLFAVNGGKKSVNFLMIYYQPVLTPYTENVSELQDPVLDEEYCVPIGDALWGGEGSFTFNLADTDKSGNLLDHAKLSYTIYADGEPVSINGTTEQPFDLNLEGEPLWSQATARGREIAYYFNGPTMNIHVMSVQMKYVAADGTAYYSKRIGYDYDHRHAVDAIHPTFGPQRSAPSTLYDLQGRPLAAPQKGINIVRRANGQILKHVVK